MDQPQSDSREMLLRVKTALSKRSVAIKAAMSGVSDQVLELANKMIIVKQKAILQAIDRTGYAVQKSQYRIIMVSKTLEPLNRAISHARNGNNSSLLNEINYPENFLLRLSYPECAILCESLHQIMLSLLPQLISEGVTPEMLNEQLTSITTFNEYNELPRQGINEKKAATKALKIALSQAENTLVRIDAAVLMLKNSFPEFVNEYFEARHIFKTGGRTLALRIRVSTPDGLPVPKVKFVIDGVKLNKKTSDKGNIEVRTLKGALYEATLTKYGFKTVNITFAITANERTDLKVIMEKISSPDTID